MAESRRQAIPLALFQIVADRAGMEYRREELEPEPGPGTEFARC